MLTTQLFVKKPLDEIETFMHSYNGTVLADVETWLNDVDSGYTAEFNGWMNTLLIRKEGVEVIQVNPGEYLVRDLNNHLHKLDGNLVASFYEPAL